APPLSADKKKVPAGAEVEVPRKQIRRRLPQNRPARTIAVAVGDAEDYITAGEYPGDGIGEIFLKVSKQGSTLSGVMDAFAIAVSLGLQYGVPLEAFAQKFVNMRFEPSGITNDPDIRFASSIVDYVFRRLALDHLTWEQREALGIRSIQERTEEAEGKIAELEAGTAPAPTPVAQPTDTVHRPTASVLDAPPC